MRGLLLGLCLVLSSAAAAQTDDEIMASYRAFNAAVEAGDEKGALKFAKEAYEKAEAGWGAKRKETAALATNYALQLAEATRWNDAAEIFERCAVIYASFPGLENERANCLLGSAGARRNDGDEDEALHRYDEVIDLTEPRAASDKVAAGYAGEAYLGLAMHVTQKERPPARATIGSGETSSRLAKLDFYKSKSVSTCDAVGEFIEKAVYLLTEGYGDESEPLVAALRLQGNCAEDREDYASAEASYERAYVIMEAMRGADDAETRSMEGRRLYAKAENYVLKFEQSEREPTRKPSRTGCRIHVRGELEIEACVDLRIPPYFPQSELFRDQQGFVLLHYSISEDGLIENLQIPVSWPGGVFDERALKAAAKWRYYAPKDQFGNAARIDDVMTMIKFMIK